MTKYKFDILVLLEYLDERDLSVYQEISQSEELKAELDKNIGWILVQWMTGSTSEHDHRELLSNFNGLCNPVWKGLSDYPELRTKLLACCGLGKKTRHRFFRPPAQQKSTKLKDFLRRLYPDINSSEVLLWVKTNEKKSILDVASSLGVQDKELKDIETEFSKIKERI